MKALGVKCSVDQVLDLINSVNFCTEQLHAEETVPLNLYTPSVMPLHLTK